MYTLFSKEQTHYRRNCFIRLIEGNYIMPMLCLNWLENRFCQGYFILWYPLTCL